jgi:formate dehydrogenase maturation protein FdhE
MFMNCQKCSADVEPGVDKNTLKNKQVTAETKAFCPFCRSEMPVNSFMLKTLVSLGQFLTNSINKTAFSFKCNTCNKIQPASLSKNKQTALCSICGTNLNLTPVMIKAMAIVKAGGIDPT